MGAAVVEWPESTSLEDVEEVVREECKKRTYDWPMVYGEPMGTDETELKFLITSGMGYATERDDLEDIQDQDMEELGTVNLTDIELALGHTFSNRMLRDLRTKGYKKKGYINKVAASAGESIGQSISVVVTRPFNRAFSTTYQSMYDDYALCSSSPTTKTGTSRANKGAVAPHTYDTVWDTVLEQRNNGLTYMGLRQRFVPWLWVTDDSHEKEYAPVFEAKQKWEPNSGNRNAHFLHDYNLKHLQCPEFSDADAKFLLAKEAKKYWIMKMIDKLHSDSDDNARQQSRSLFWLVRFIVGVWHREGCYGIPGS